MNTAYKQWKKWMADPKILKRVGIVIFFATFLLFNFIYNCVQLFFYATKGSTFESFSQNWEYFKYLFSQNILISFFPRLTKASYWLFLFLVLSIIGFLTWKLLYGARRSFRDLNKGSKGTAKWTTLDDIREQYPKVPLDKNIEFDERPGLPIAIDPNRKEIYIDPDNTNSKTFGGTQTGKTQYITYPLLDLMIRSKKPDSGLVNDIKGDIVRRTWLHPMANKKFHLKAFNLVNPVNSLRFNPIHGVRKYWQTDLNRAQRMLTTVSHDFYYEPDAKDPIWNLGAESIFKAVTVLITEIAFQEEHPEWINTTALTNFARVLTREKDKDEKGNTLLDRYIEALDPTHLASKYYAQALQGTAQQRKSFSMIFFGKLEFLNSPEMMTLTSGNDIEFEELVYPKDGKPTLLFVIFPYANDAYSKMLGLFYNQLYQEIAEEATLRGKKYDFRLQSILEEFPNILPIQNIKKHMNVGLEAGNIVRIFSQSKHQIYDNYGDTVGKSILQAAGNTMFIMSDDNDDADEFSKDLGESTLIMEQRSGDPLALDKSYTEMEDGRPLMYAHELRNIFQSEAILTRSKKRKDLKGRDVRPHPIKAVKKEVQDGNKTYYEDYMNFKGAYEYLFAEAGGDFDDHGMGLNDFDFREGVDIINGKKAERMISEKDIVIPEKTIMKYVKPMVATEEEIREGQEEAKDKGKKRPRVNSTPSQVPQESEQIPPQTLYTVEAQNETVDSPLLEEIFDRELLEPLIEQYFSADIRAWVATDIRTVAQLQNLIKEQLKNLSPEAQHEFTGKYQKLKKG